MNAGQRGAVTIATNMAGRGTDIKLGPGVKELGVQQLLVLNVTNHVVLITSFVVVLVVRVTLVILVSICHLKMTLMKRFGGDRVKDFVDRLSDNDDDKVIESRLITRQVESAQKRVEGNNYDTRKQTLQYDDVMRYST